MAKFLQDRNHGKNGVKPDQRHRTMTHLSARDQLRPECPFLSNAEMIVHRLTDDGGMDTIGPSLPNKMFYPPHQPFLINKYSQEDPPLKRNPRLTDGLNRAHGCCSIAFGITRPSSVNPV